MRTTSWPIKWRRLLCIASACGRAGTSSRGQVGGACGRDDWRHFGGLFVQNETKHRNRIRGWFAGAIALAAMAVFAFCIANVWAANESAVAVKPIAGGDGAPPPRRV